MKKLTSNDIRNFWLEFFKSKQHYIVPSASLIPIEDDSLLFINSGVATLKKYFAGIDQPPSKRMTNSQKSIRTGDIENIGKTARHHTMFEMLGNFSIGDYFKKEAIEFAWEFLTSPKWLGLDKNKLYFTYFKGNSKIEEDIEAVDTWIKMGVNKDHIFAMGEDTNFWDMGQGPCGPSTEIFYDKGSHYDLRSAKELIQGDLANDRYIEIWNIVFSQFNNDGNKNYTLLPQKNIDTGAGLERLVSCIQETPTNFETDLFKPIIAKIDQLTDKKYVYDYVPGKLEQSIELDQQRFKAIADFARSSTFAITDGVIPSNTGRGYVIRRIIRKAITYGKGLGINEPFLHKLVSVISNTMGEFYPNLITNLSKVEKLILEEEILFLATLEKGVKIFNELVETSKQKNILEGDIAFKLFETYGLPLELTQELANQIGKQVDINRFEKLHSDFVKLSQSSAKVSKAMEQQEDYFSNLPSTKFLGYEKLNLKSKIIGIETKDNKTFIALDQTVFYATSGGQEFDTGTINNHIVSNVVKNASGVFIHTIESCHDLKVGMEVDLEVNKVRRDRLTKNHSAVHLLFAAIEKVMNVKLPQVGSKVEQDYFRFDFASSKKLTNEEVNSVEALVNDWIKKSISCHIEEMPQAKAKSMGATFLDGTKYGEVVRVVQFNGVAIDLCGGTHVKNTSEIEAVAILTIESKGSGIYRITATSGKKEIKERMIEINSISLNQLLTEVNTRFEKLKELLNNLSNDRLISMLLKAHAEISHVDIEITPISFKEKLYTKKEVFIKSVDLITLETVNLFAQELLNKDINLAFDIDAKIMIDSMKKLTNEKTRIFSTNKNIVIKSKISSEQLNNWAKEIGLKGKSVSSISTFNGDSNQITKLIEKINNV